MRGPYTFEIDGDKIAPSEFGELRDFRGEPIHNPDMLWKSAQQAAERVAFDLAGDSSLVIRITGFVGGVEQSVGQVSSINDRPGDPSVVLVCNYSKKSGGRRIRRAV